SRYRHDHVRLPAGWSVHSISFSWKQPALFRDFRPMPCSWPEPAFQVYLCGMELRQLRYFVAVAEEANISRAAQKIFLTQPALSRQVKALEEEIGQCLLERQAHSIRLTAAGEVLL